MTDDNKKENSIITSSSTDLGRVGNSIEITNKLLLEIDGRKRIIPYETVKIGKQTWMTNNLNVEEFSNGDKIPIAKTAIEWEEAGSLGKPICSFYPINSNQNNNRVNFKFITN